MTSKYVAIEKINEAWKTGNPQNVVKKNNSHDPEIARAPDPNRLPLP